MIKLRREEQRDEVPDCCEPRGETTRLPDLSVSLDTASSEHGRTLLHSQLPTAANLMCASTFRLSSLDPGLVVAAAEITSSSRADEFGRHCRYQLGWSSLRGVVLRIELEVHAERQLFLVLSLELLVHGSQQKQQQFRRRTHSLHLFFAASSFPAATLHCRPMEPQNECHLSTK